MATLQVEIVLTSHVCGECGIVFGLEKRYFTKLKESGEGFYCPNGHCRCFRESETDRLKKELAQEAKTREWLETSLRTALEDRDRNERQRAAAQGQLTKTKNRIANGICPICNRQFSVLHKHMTTQHPEYTKEEEAG